MNARPSLAPEPLPGFREGRENVGLDGSGLRVGNPESVDGSVTVLPRMLRPSKIWGRRDLGCRNSDYWSRSIARMEVGKKEIPSTSCDHEYTDVAVPLFHVFPRKIRRFTFSKFLDNCSIKSWSSLVCTLGVLPSGNLSGVQTQQMIASLIAAIKFAGTTGFLAIIFAYSLLETNPTPGSLSAIGNILVSAGLAILGSWLLWYLKDRSAAKKNAALADKKSQDAVTATAGLVAESSVDERKDIRATLMSHIAGLERTIERQQIMIDQQDKMIASQSSLITSYEPIITRFAILEKQNSQVLELVASFVKK